MVFSSFFKTFQRPWRSNKVRHGDISELSPSSKRIYNGNADPNAQRSLKVLSYSRRKAKHYIVDPGGKFSQRWSMFFLTASLASLLVDPLFFLLPEVRPELCIRLGVKLKVILTGIRSAIDVVYIVHIVLQFRTAYVAPSSRVMGAGELLIHPRRIATMYVRLSFWVDISAALPLPQVFIWGLLPNIGSSSKFRVYLMFILTIQMQQMVLRFFLSYMTYLQVCKTSTIIPENPWVGVVYNLLFYLCLCSFTGNCWYILSIQRQKGCWDLICIHESSTCRDKFFDCGTLGDPSRISWLQFSNITSFCDPSNSFYSYGIYDTTVTENVSTGGFFSKFLYCLWWGTMNLSTQAQNLATSIDAAENTFSCLVGIMGLILFGFAMANIQKYIRQTTVRREQWRLEQSDLEEWMHHRLLPKELMQSIRKYYNYKWVATQGVDEQTMLDGLPLNLRRQTKLYLCLNLVRQVPLFDQLDERTLAVICERLKPALYTEEMYLAEEGEPVKEMFFIVRGYLYSYTNAKFFNGTKLGPNEFCGEELLAWILDRRQSDTLPNSTQTVKVVSDVEGFTLKAEDLKFVASQFRKMINCQICRNLRFYSQQWRTWAVCLIQAAWRRHKRMRGRGMREPTAHMLQDIQEFRHDC